MVDLWKDFRYGVRGLGRSPGFAFAAIATLTLTIGASTAAFSIVNGILLEPLPFDEPSQLVDMVQTRPDQSFVSGFFDLQVVGDFRDELRTLAGLAASVALTRFLESYLFEIEAADSWVYAVVVVGGLALVGIASWFPARRAARFDPMSALRYE